MTASMMIDDIDYREQLGIGSTIEQRGICLGHPEYRQWELYNKHVHSWWKLASFSTADGFARSIELIMHQAKHWYEFFFMMLCNEIFVLQ
jgi:hypothetical protein